MPIPAGTILDDVYLPMHVAREGLRVIFVPQARAWDVADQGTEKEFARKVRTLSGNYQLVQLAPWLLSSSNPLRFEFVSHKLLRLLAPVALISALGSSLLLYQASFFQIALGIQLAFYGLSAIAMLKLPMGPLARLADAARTFVVLNMAAAVAMLTFISGRRATWKPSKEKIEKDVRVSAHAG